MKNIGSIRSFSVSACVVLLLLTTNSFGEATGFLTDVKIAPNQKRIVVKHEGNIGKHAAFVIERPYRLVVDFSSTGLGRISRKINVNGSEIREIRLGQTPSRARMVLDFGSNPVPAFQIQRMDGAVLVMLGNTAGTSSTQNPAGSTETERRISSPDNGTPVPPVASPLVVKKAEVKDDLVYVELADKNKQGKTYRLVVDCSPRNLVVRQASLSDDTGTLKRFDLAESASAKKGALEAKMAAGKGPRRIGEGDEPFVRPKFHWGKPVVRARQPEGEQEKTRGPFKLEELKLQVRKQDT